MKKGMNFKYLAITGNLIGLMTAPNNKTVSAGGYTLSVNDKQVYTLTDNKGKILDEWEGIPTYKFETN
jgi:hypothetical protein